MDLKFWTMGSLARASWGNVGVSVVVVLLVSVFFLTQFRSLNVLLMGDEAATTLGLNTNLCRWAYLTISALMVGTLVSSVGTIGLLVLSFRILRARLLGPITEGWCQLRWYWELFSFSGQMLALVPS